MKTKLWTRTGILIQKHAQNQTRCWVKLIEIYTKRKNQTDGRTNLIRNDYISLWVNRGVKKSDPINGNKNEKPNQKNV